MSLAQDLSGVVAAKTASVLQNFRCLINPEWIEEALQATGTATVRRRRLPAEQVLWLVVGMAMMRDRPIADIVSALGLSLPDARRSEVAPSAIVAARRRLGDKPVEYLFHRTADKWAFESAEAHRWRGLQLFGIDGTTLRVADSNENREHFGLASGGKRDASGYPLVRVVALMAVRSHLLADAHFGPYKHGEHTLAKELWERIPDHSLILIDRDFLTPKIVVPLQRGGTERHWLMRTKKNTKWKVLQTLGPKDVLVELETSRQARADDPSLPSTWTARAIAYSYKGHKSGWLLTSLVDPKLYPRKELVALYHERWELELGFDEVKTEMRDSEFSLRSKTVEGTCQELWGTFLAYNLVRKEMERVADKAGVEPIMISFATSLRLISDVWLLCAGNPDAIPDFLRRLETSMRRLVLPPRRSERAYPRAVKIKMSCYPKKRRPSPRRRLKRPPRRRPQQETPPPGARLDPEFQREAR